MKYENERIDRLDLPQGEVQESLVIDGCVINELLIGAPVFLAPVTISNCTIKYLHAIGGSFREGISITNCIITDYANFEAGGYNKPGKEYRIENNIFNCYVEFIDARYEGLFIFCNNILLAGTDLLASRSKSFETHFDGGYVVENNLGNLSYEGEMQ